MKTVCKKLLSLMLVAMLLVSAVPFQAFASEGAESYSVSVYFYNGTTDNYLAQTGGMTKAAGSTFDVAAETFSRYSSDEKAIAAIYKDGTAASNKVTATSYTVDADMTFYVCLVQKNAKLTLNAGANGGTFSSTTDSSTTREYNVTYGSATESGITAAKSGYEFLGWFENQDGTGDEFTPGQNWNYNGDKTFYACYSLKTSTLQIKAKYYVGGSLAKTVALEPKTLAESQFVLEYLYEIKNQLVSVPAGYSWDGFFYDYDGNDKLTQQDLAATAERSVCVKFVANTYTLTFNANGGTVSPTSKTVTYDAAVGTLPTPTKKGGVFSHWEDDNGTVYTASTVYKVAGNTQLTARWENEAYVLLAIHTDTTSNPIYVQMNGYIAGDEITRAAVETIVKKYYSGSSMKLSGLYTDAAWNDYVADKNPTAEETFTVTSSCTVHVLVSNATLSGSSSGSSGSSSSSGTTGTTDSTNPQTGDGIVLALAAMMSTGGAALVLGKKKFF